MVIQVYPAASFGRVALWRGLLSATLPPLYLPCFFSLLSLKNLCQFFEYFINELNFAHKKASRLNNIISFSSFF